LANNRLRGWFSITFKPTRIRGNASSNLNVPVITYFQIFSLFQRLIYSVSSNEPLSYFTPSMVELFMQLYLKHFNQHWPLADPMTFRSSEIPAPLAVAMCCIGAMYDSQPESKRFAAAVVLEQRPALFSKMVRLMKTLFQGH
jgi:hypothetical protein